MAKNPSYKSPVPVKKPGNGKKTGYSKSPAKGGIPPGMAKRPAGAPAPGCAAG